MAHDARKRPLARRMLIMLAFIVLLVAALAGGKYLHIRKLIASIPQAGPQVVTALAVESQTWRPELEAVGTLAPVQGADLASEVGGIVQKVDFTSGQDVRAGALLVQLNDAADRAALEALQAAADQAATVLRRSEAQVQARAISPAVYDADASDLKTRRAQVAQQAAIVARKAIRAPFAGRLGIAAVNEGQYVNPGDVLVTLQTLDPVYVNFSLPQQQLEGLATGQDVSVRVDALPGRAFQGQINAISPKVDASTRSVLVQATLANPEYALRPGMFATVRVDIGNEKQWLTIPQTAIAYNPYGATVFLIEAAKDGGPAAGSPPAGAAPQLVARQVFVETGPTRGDQVAITKGLEAGQRIVTSGQIKLRNGTPVVIDNTVVPANDPDPKPQER